LKENLTYDRTLGVVRSARVHLVMPKQSCLRARSGGEGFGGAEAERSFLGEERRMRSVAWWLGRRESESGRCESCRCRWARKFEAKSKNAVAADVEQEMEAKLVAMLEPLLDMTMCGRR